MSNKPKTTRHDFEVWFAKRLIKGMNESAPETSEAELPEHLQFLLRVAEANKWRQWVPLEGVVITSQDHTSFQICFMSGYLTKKGECITINGTGHAKLSELEGRGK